MKDIFKVHNLDARKIKEIVPENTVDVTITSPPYFDLKDYGSKNQIGYGQDYEEYLMDLKSVFEQVHDVTKDSGTLWVIIDTYRKDNEVVPLPFDFSNTISKIGWKLQEVIIWGKDRTVPWAHKGQMRSLFEYILVFSKTRDYQFHIDDVRDFESLKKWWVKYPERYNPRGKTPDAIWNFDIPTQGSWGNGYIRHFCPLPEEMIAQMLKLTTRENDVVLDCFSGSGAVLSKAANMKRKFIGFELNKDYIKMFDKYLAKTGKQKIEEFEKDERNLIGQDKFQKLILNLRALKYARLIHKRVEDKGITDIVKIFVKRTRQKPTKSNSLIVVNYHILIRNKSSKHKIKQIINDVISRPSLSKFGIESKIEIVDSLNNFTNLLTPKKLYVYTSQVTHKFKKQFNVKDLSKASTKDIIISPIKVDLDERDYE